MELKGSTALKHSLAREEGWNRPQTDRLPGKSFVIYGAGNICSELHTRRSRKTILAASVMSLSSGLLVLTTLVTLLVLLRADNVLNRCHDMCRGEDQLKASCRAELHCDDLLPNIDAYMRCMGPCKDLGANCFQRCAFNTDQIKSHCLRQCGVIVADESSAGVDNIGRGVAGGNDAVANNAEETSGNVNGGGTGAGLSTTVCYRSCYDEFLNDAMDRLYRKAPES